MFSYFSGNIKFVRPLGVVSFDDFIRAHKHPKQRTRDILAEIKTLDMSVESSKLLKRQLKAKLFAFTPSVIIKDNTSRKYDNILSFSGYAQLDFDKLENENEAINLKQYLFETYPMIVAAYLSPSRNGVKCLIQIPKISIEAGIDAAVKEYKDYYRAIQSEFKNYNGFDVAPQNAVLPLFLSIDENILYRKTDNVWDIKEDLPVITPTNFKYEYNDKQTYFYNKTVRILKDRINSIVSDGHPQVVKASLILGSRVGAGYIDKFEAEDLIINAINNNQYLSKGVAGYVKTAMWGIDNGMRQPKYY